MTPPRLLVDAEVVSGEAHALPLSWLDGFELVPYPVRQLELGADAPFALVRSMTPVGERQLRALPGLRAVATLSSGTDHLREPDLTRADVALLTGRGGNARAVADWCDWALHRLTRRTPGTESLRGLRVLVVGVGAVGSLVARAMRERGAGLSLHDPPRAMVEPKGPAEIAGLTWTGTEDLDALEPDVVTLHLPLVHDGQHPTAGWLSARRLERWTKTKKLVVLQPSRGGVLDEPSAAALRRSGHIAGLAVDTWEHEPRPSVALLAQVDLATPHLAGHSAQGKLDVARRAVRRLRALAGLPTALDLAQATLARLGTLADADPWLALDAAAHALRTDPAAFAHIRHTHLRSESALVSQWRDDPFGLR